MKSRFISLTFVTLMLFALLSLVSSAALAQEGELKVVDEVIAQVNEDVITLSMVRRETKQRIEALKQGGMPEQQATDEVTKHQAELIATLINEQLLMQKGKELDLASEVEAEVNRRMLDVAKEQGITSIEKLDEAMKGSGMDPVATRQTLRTEIMKQAVIQQEVDRKVFFGLPLDELKKYFEANRAKFTKPESVVLSEIFLSYAGKNEADVRARALELVTQLRSGADFAALAAANSERELNGVRVAPQNKGKVGRFEMPNLREEIAKQIKGVKVGGVSDPLRINDGFQILRVDERTEASSTAVFNENQVREAITMERSPKERELYLRNLLNDAYVKISDSYRASVEPLLKLNTAAAAKSDDSSTSGTNSEKNKNKKP
ncbi:MAG: peptidyl-prolyl cis-trans isomerase [Pyrinomonadaceae bacterium]|nr:peptidyl-prolyl cis-trans isomerase [Pyrinomonadaceae bacterium]